MSPRNRQHVAMAVLSVALLASGARAIAAKKQEFFPPEVVDSVWWRDLPVGETPLWLPDALAGNASRIRLSISGIVRVRLVIRVDERTDGKFVGHVILVTLGRSGRRQKTISRIFRISAADMAEFHQQTSSAKLWELYPEHWVSSDGNDICIDGEQLVFERVDERGYRFSEMNAQCAAPRGAINGARFLLDKAGMRKFHRLLQ